MLALSLGGLPAFADVPTVANSEPAHERRTVHLQELWRIGGEDGDHMFGLMIEGICDEQGNVYLLDQQLNQATVISPDGTILRTLGREGDGPGEVRTPQGIVLMPDGTVGLAMQFPGKFIKLTRDGEPAGSVTVSGGPEAKSGYTFLAGCASRGGTLLIAGQFTSPVENGQDRTSYLAAIAPAGEELVRFREFNTVLDFQKAHFVEREMAPSFHLASAVGPDGKVYTLRERTEYAIEVFRPDGTLERIVQREFKTRNRDQDELRRWNALFEVQARNLPFDITWEVEDLEPAISGLHVSADGTLWVQHSLSGYAEPDGIFMTYDTFDPDGRYLREVSVACDANPKHDGLILLDDGRVLLVKGLVLARLTATGSQGAVFGEEDETGPMEVICCRFVE